MTSRQKVPPTVSKGARIAYPAPCDPPPRPEPNTVLRLYVCRVGVRGDRCDGCPKRLPPSSLAVVRTDGYLFCAEDCARAHPASLPISSERPS